MCDSKIICPPPSSVVLDFLDPFQRSSPPLNTSLNLLMDSPLQTVAGRYVNDASGGDKHRSAEAGRKGEDTAELAGNSREGAGVAATSDGDAQEEGD